MSESPLQAESYRRGAKLRAYELLVVLPVLLWLGTTFSRHHREFLDWRILVWAAAVAIVDLLPIRGSSEMAFSLSFPIELSAALVFSPAWPP